MAAPGVRREGDNPLGDADEEAESETTPRSAAISEAWVALLV